MLTCFKWQSLLGVVFLAQAALVRAEQASGPQRPLIFGTVAEMKRRGQDASADYRAEVKLTLEVVSSGYIGQPATFEVSIHNLGPYPTPANASLLIKFGTVVGDEDYGLLFGELAPGERRVVQFKHAPLLPSVDVVVSEGIWDRISLGSTRSRVQKRVSSVYDP